MVVGNVSKVSGKIKYPNFRFYFINLHRYTDLISLTEI